MNLTLAYRGRSTVTSRPPGLDVSLAPNLRRDRVSYEGTLRHPLRFREAIGALHDVVVSDLRYAAARQDRLTRPTRPSRTSARAELRRQVVSRGRGRAPRDSTPSYPKSMSMPTREAIQASAKALLGRTAEVLQLPQPPRPRALAAADAVRPGDHGGARLPLLRVLQRRREQLRLPDRRPRGLRAASATSRWARPTSITPGRCTSTSRSCGATARRGSSIDPAGFEVQTEQAEGYREEKIDLPPSWLRGFMQLQAAMSLPMRRVPISREGLYNVLAFLKRHRAARSPRAVRFELEPGRPVGGRARAVGAADRPARNALRRPARRDDPRLGPRPAPACWPGCCRCWTRRRSTCSGPGCRASGRSGWARCGCCWASRAGRRTTGPAPRRSTSSRRRPSRATTCWPTSRRRSASARRSASSRSASARARPRRLVAAGLNRLALLGQVIHDLPAGLYRWRQVMPVALSLDADRSGAPRDRGRAPAGRARHGDGRPRREPARRPAHPRGRSVRGRAVSLLLDADGRMLRGRCTCSHHFTGGLRKGPCRHLQALRDHGREQDTTRASIARRVVSAMIR